MEVYDKKLIQAGMVQSIAQAFFSWSMPTGRQTPSTFLKAYLDIIVTFFNMYEKCRWKSTIENTYSLLFPYLMDKICMGEKD